MFLAALKSGSFSRLEWENILIRALCWRRRIRHHSQPSIGGRLNVIFVMNRSRFSLPCCIQSNRITSCIQWWERRLRTCQGSSSHSLLTLWSSRWCTEISVHSEHLVRSLDVSSRHLNSNTRHIETFLNWANVLFSKTHLVISREHATSVIVGDAWRPCKHLLLWLWYFQDVAAND